MRARNSHCISALWLAVVLLYCQPGITVDLYQEHSLLVYLPTSARRDSEHFFDTYFGYSLLLRENTSSLVVGAAEWYNPLNVDNTLNTIGEVFNCDLNTQRNVNGSCYANVHYTNLKELPDEMLLGHSMTEIPGKFLVICAPLWRQKETIDEKRKEWRFKGACVTSPPSQRALIPFEDSTNNYRDEKVNDKTDRVPYYAHALAGFSSAVSPDHKWLLLGAPAFHYFKGGIARYQLDDYNNFNLRSEVSFDSLQWDSYMGYSVTTARVSHKAKEPGTEPDGRQFVVGGAPRGGNRCQGEVIVFTLEDEKDQRTVLARLNGTQMGEYFGASLLAVDINGDSRTDLLVGAPLHKYDTEERERYDQGVVYVYISELTESGFQLKFSKIVRGSGASRARFGYSLADLGDVDGDGFNDVAIGAPFEEFGAVYIFRSGPSGLRDTYSQKIAPNRTDLQGFGFSLSSGVDIDKNGCKDLAVGSVMSNKAVTLRCSPMLVVKARIDVEGDSVPMCRGVVGLATTTSTLNAKFCLSVDKPRKEWESATVDVISSITKGKQLLGRLESRDESYFRVTPNMTNECKTLQIHKNSTEKEMTLKFTLDETINEQTYSFDMNMARLGEDSVLSDELTAYFVDCGDDMVCTPNLQLQIHKFSDPYVPGSRDHKLGFNVTINNTGELAYVYTLRLNMPLTELKNIPRDCIKNGSVLECDPGRGFGSGANRTWTFELQPFDSFLPPRPLNFTYELLDCETVTQTGNIDIDVQLRANMSLTGKSFPERIAYSSTTAANGTETLNHVFSIVNYGPSDWPEAVIEFTLAPEVTVETHTMPACRTPPPTTSASLVCVYNVSVGAVNMLTIVLPLTVNSDMLPYFNSNGLKIETLATLTYGKFKRTATVSTPYQTEKARSIWPIVVGVVVGLLLIALIIYVMHRCGFFKRTKKEELETKKKESLVEPSPSTVRPLSVTEEAAEPMLSNPH